MDAIEYYQRDFWYRNKHGIIYSGYFIISW